MTLATKPTEVEAMDGPAWRQTLKDLPVTVLSTALGYGIGKTMADVAMKHLSTQATMPSWMRFAPHVVGAVSSIAAARTRGILKERRDAARAADADAKIREAAKKLGKS